MIPDWLREKVGVPVLRNPQRRPDGTRYYVRVFDASAIEWNVDPDVAIYLPYVAMIDATEDGRLAGVGVRRSSTFTTGEPYFVYYINLDDNVIRSQLG